MATCLTTYVHSRQQYHLRPAIHNGTHTPLFRGVYIVHDTGVYNNLTVWLLCIILHIQRTQLELESMQQKCDAWREEVEKLSPLRDQLARANQDISQLQQDLARLSHDNSRLQQELARVSEDNTGLARQLQEIDPTQVHITFTKYVQKNTVYG